MRIGIAITRASALQPSWTTTHLVVALLNAGHVVRVVESWDFEVNAAGRLLARAHAFDDPLSEAAVCAQLHAHGAKRVFVEVQKFDALLLRINPMDSAVLAFAQRAALTGVCVLNDPFVLPMVSHKSFLATLHDVPMPETLVTRSRNAIQHFSSSCSDGVVIKPARASGGRGVVYVPKPHAHAVEKAMDRAAVYGDGYLVVQEYLPEAVDGEKRLLWVGGRVLGGYRRMRAPGEFRHNLKQGARPEACDLSDSDHAIERALQPYLEAAGVWFAGLDVIGGKLIEVNTLNPGGSAFIEQTSGQSVGPQIVQSLEEEIARHQNLSRDMDEGDSPMGWVKASKRIASDNV